MSKRFDGREDEQKAVVSVNHIATGRHSYVSQTPMPNFPITTAVGDGNADEAAKIAAMFASTNEQWQSTQDKMTRYVSCLSVYCCFWLQILIGMHMLV